MAPETESHLSSYMDNRFTNLTAYKNILKAISNIFTLPEEKMVESIKLAKKTLKVIEISTKFLIVLVGAMVTSICLHIPQDVGAK